MNYRLKRAIVWLMRFSHLGGNGVQSPFVYRFVCEVINNHTAYYAYSDMQQQLSALSLQQRKVARLIFRLANRVQPTMVLLPESVQQFAPFAARGCKRATITTYSDIKSLHPGSEPVLLIAETPGDIPNLPDNSLALILNIRKKNKNAWRDLIAQPWATLTFDLYTQGIILYNNEKHKQHFIINF